MAAFAPALRKLLALEGGYVDDPSDRGGATNHGITQRTLAAWWKSVGREGHPTRDDVRNLTEDEAAQIYRAFFWDRYGLDAIIDQSVADKLLDMMVVSGPTRGVTILQRALALPEAQCDGILGSRTLLAANAHDPGELLFALRAQAKAWFHSIVDNDPSQKRFLSGWLNRAGS